MNSKQRKQDYRKKILIITNFISVFEDRISEWKIDGEITKEDVINEIETVIRECAKK